VSIDVTERSLAVLNGAGGSARLRHGDWYGPIRVRADPEAEHQPAGGYTDAYELICCACGDHPDLDYRDISPELQRIRGPYPVAAGVGAYEKHLELRHRRQPTRRAGRPVHDSSG